MNMSKLTYNNWKEHTDSNDSNDDERREIWNHVCFKKWNSKEEKVEYDINQTIFRMQNQIEFVLSLQKKRKKRNAKIKKCRKLPGILPTKKNEKLKKKIQKMK